MNERIWILYIFFLLFNCNGNFSNLTLKCLFILYPKNKEEPREDEFLLVRIFFSISTLQTAWRANWTESSGFWCNGRQEGQKTRRTSLEATLTNVGASVQKFLCTHICACTRACMDIFQFRSLDTLICLNQISFWHFLWFKHVSLSRMIFFFRWTALLSQSCFLPLIVV